MRLIDADELIPLIKMGECNIYDEYCQGRNGGIDFAIERIKQMPTIDRLNVTLDEELVAKAIERQRKATGQKKGKWIRWYEEKETATGVGHVPHCKCPECGTEIDPYVANHVNYCAICGCDMRKEGKQIWN